MLLRWITLSLTVGGFCTIFAIFMIRRLLHNCHLATREFRHKSVSVLVPNPRLLCVGSVRERGIFLKRSRRTWRLLLLAGVLSSPCVMAQNYSYYGVNFPSSAHTRGLGINNNGQIVGDYWTNQSGTPRYGFLLTNGQYLKINYPGSTSTSASAINDLGQVVGWYSDTSNNVHGFLLNNAQCLQKGSSATCEAQYQDVTYPGATVTFCNGINDVGQIVGQATTIGNFLLTNGQWTPIVVSPPDPDAVAEGINSAGEVVGYLYTNGESFFWVNGETTAFADPDGTPVFAYGINDKGNAVGSSCCENVFGFLYDGASFTRIYYPLSSTSWAQGINNYDQVVGQYLDSSGNRHGFLAQLPCGDERDLLLAEYPQYNISFLPSCTQMTATAHSNYFRFSSINYPCRSQEPAEYGHAIIAKSLVSPASSGYGLDAWRVDYAGPRTITSGYRDPKQNSGCGGATNSPHLFGQAADFANRSYSTNCGTGTACLKEWSAMVSAARKAQADYIEPVAGPCGHKCTHADWRDHETLFAQ
jgi:probable HAF family extracellular repeat protein